MSGLIVAETRRQIVAQQYDDEFSVDAVAALGARRLAAILVDHLYHDAGLAQALRMALAAGSSDDELVQVLRTEIDAVRSNCRYCDYRESKTLALELDRIRTAIVEHLLPRLPGAAADLLGRLIRLDHHVFKHADDSGGVVGSVMTEAVTDFGRALAAIPDRNTRILADEVFALFTANAYGVHSGVIGVCKDALGSRGLEELEHLFRSRLVRAPALIESDSRHVLTGGLAAIADAREDVDGFIDAHQLAGNEDLAVKDIVQRLVGAGRLHEALQRLEHAEAGDRRFSPLKELRVEILDRLGRSDEAQAVRWAMFLQSLSARILDDYLARTPEGARAGTIDKAIASARQHRDLPAALSLLSRIAPGFAAEMATNRLPELNGEPYFILRPVAERLAGDFPLAAVLLRRRIADAVLLRAKSQSYEHAVQDLMASEETAAKVTDWLGMLPQEAVSPTDIRAASTEVRVLETHECGRVELAQMAADIQCIQP